MIAVAMEDVLLLLDRKNGKWNVSEKLANMQPQCVAVDPQEPGKAYCGTSANGLWITKDYGKIWSEIGHFSSDITSLAVGRESHGQSTIYVGTEPSALYKSTDGGLTWDVSSSIADLPSANTWSFPPKPDTHHVRFIGLDPVKTGFLYVAIEAGALIRSPDSGRTWWDRVNGGPYDTHTLASARQAPGKLCSSAGDGYFESHDYGDSWEKKMKGLKHHYLFGVVMDPVDPDVVIVSASDGPWTAYNSERAESHVYRKFHDEDWKEVREGLPDPEGTTVSAFAVNNNAPGELFASNNMGVFVSENKGLSWSKLAIPWPGSYTKRLARTVAVGMTGASAAFTSDHAKSGSFGLLLERIEVEKWSFMQRFLSRVFHTTRD